MAWELIASGDNTNINDVITHEETEVAEGQRCRLDCECFVPVPTWQIDNLRNSLVFAGVEELQIVASGNTVQIFWSKGFPWAAVIILALIAIIVIVSWLFFKEAKQTVGPVGVKLLIAGGVLLTFGLAYSLFRRRTEHV